MLPKEEWLPQAKRLAVGMQTRLFHRREKRPNLVVGNNADKYWAYCQACKKGGVEEKTHVRLDVASPERKRSNLSMPTDMQRVCDLDMTLQAPLLGFLAKKGMDHCMLPPPWYSPSRKRLLICHDQREWLGRDVTGDALEKWLTYQGTQYLGYVAVHGNPALAVVVEDTFSYYKVRWATNHSISVYCALGTGIKDALAHELLRHKEVLWMFDGDTAGDVGATKGVARMRGLGVKSRKTLAPWGFDPKDLTAEQIRLILGVQT